MLKILPNVPAADENFNEAAYLAANPDVAAAVSNGICPSGWVHFDLYGRHEDRLLRPELCLSGAIQLSRIEKLRYGLKLEGKGLEIGPYFRPLMPKSEGYKVKTIDVFTREQLLKIAVQQQVDPSKIEEVDFIWDGRDLSEITGYAGDLDWIVSSHVIEHVPNLIGFLQQCSKLLKDDGILSLAVPDKRYCFDFFRSRTSLSAVIDTHLGTQKTHTPGAVAEYFLYNCRKGRALAWGPTHRGALTLTHPLRFVQEVFRKALTSDEYIDIHAWCFTPSYFRLIMHQLFLLEFIDLKELSFMESAEGEFFVSMSRTAPEPVVADLDLMRLAAQENDADLFES
jgi:SAM-dependent methyltransferase